MVITLTWLCIYVMFFDSHIPQHNAQKEAIRKLSAALYLSDSFIICVSVEPVAVRINHGLQDHITGRQVRKHTYDYLVIRQGTFG
jgi:uncharacterized membrane protein